jgi:hypothetical protein
LPFKCNLQRYSVGVVPPVNTVALATGTGTGTVVTVGKFGPFVDKRSFSSGGGGGGVVARKTVTRREKQAITEVGLYTCVVLLQFVCTS